MEDILIFYLMILFKELWWEGFPFPWSFHFHIEGVLLKFYSWLHLTLHSFSLNEGWLQNDRPWNFCFISLTGSPPVPRGKNCVRDLECVSNCGFHCLPWAEMLAMSNFQSELYSFIWGLSLQSLTETLNGRWAQFLSANAVFPSFVARCIMYHLGI